MKIPIQKIAAITNATAHLSINEGFVNNIFIDSRNSHKSPNSLFVALQGPNHDGHKYIHELITAGVQYFVVHQIPEGFEYKAQFFVVQNTLTALQALATFYRNIFDIKTIAITGSNGKTIVKEWLNHALSSDYHIIRSPKSYNSQVGVPLSVFGINEQHSLAIFEAGISTTHEMERLEEIIKPSLGILTNIGSAHAEGFENDRHKIAEKTKLFKNCTLVIYKKEYALEEYLSEKTKLFNWSFEDNEAVVYFLKKEISNHHTSLTYTYKNEQYCIQIPFTDEASIENCISLLLVLLYFEYQIQDIQDKMNKLYPIEMRLQVKRGINNCLLIDDSYSSDFESLKIALDFLKQQNQFSRKTLIISDVYQSGLQDGVLYQKLAELIASSDIVKTITVGKIINEYSYLFKNATTYDNTNALISDFDNLDFNNETILVKGARSFQFENIIELLEEKKHETVLEINLNSISHNYNFFRAKMKPSIKMMVMVKAFGYGNGGAEIASLLEFHHVDYLGVAFADEGIALKNYGIKTPIMVMNPENSSFASIIKYQLEPEIYSLNGLQHFLKIAQEKGIQNYPIHIKIDTGMHRLGFENKNIETLISILKNTNLVEVKSILSHLATSDDPVHFEFAKYQIQLFEQITTRLMQALDITILRHILNTSGISNFPDAQFDMVRLGIGLYGVSNDAEEQKKLELVGTLKSVISQIRTINAGETVGYGRRFVAQKTTTMATIPIGYADGIARAWGNGVGYVTVNNCKAPIIGSICMDMLMIDISEINCVEGDTVVVFGKNPSVIEMAKSQNTIPYEILTSISQRVKRVFYR